tara:strand:- start:835 stop:1062 length:228 start_codon:yes stop_codon:yes gene_type:complete
VNTKLGEGKFLCGITGLAKNAASIMGGYTHIILNPKAVILSFCSMFLMGLRFAKSVTAKLIRMGLINPKGLGFGV